MILNLLLNTQIQPKQEYNPNKKRKIPTAFDDMKH